MKLQKVANNKPKEHCSNLTHQIIFQGHISLSINKETWKLPCKSIGERKKTQTFHMHFSSYWNGVWVHIYQNTYLNQVG